MPTFKGVTNNAAGLLNANITSGATSLTLQSGQGAKFPASNFWATIFSGTVEAANEIVLVGSRTGDVLSSIARAQQGTTAQAWSAGANVQILWTAGHATEIQDAVNAFALAGTLEVLHLLLPTAEPTDSLTDKIEIFTKKASSGKSTIGMRTDEGVEDLTTFQPVKALRIWVNGIEYRIALDPV
ncbi:MAG: hypothetical protein HUU16_00150 [Candidatus Omnitrophica bacterium]|nr:hypothetical protein [Candidatus Omnitrophota bacterium]